MKKAIELLCNNILLKTISLISALTFWYFFSGIHPTTISLAIPVCFYDTSAQQQIDAPDQVTIVLAGKRNTLRSITYSELALHIDAQQLHTGKQALTLSNAQLFLPESIKLVHYTPSPLIVTVRTDTTDNQKTV